MMCEPSTGASSKYVPVWSGPSGQQVLIMREQVILLDDRGFKLAVD